LFSIFSQSRHENGNGGGGGGVEEGGGVGVGGAEGVGHNLEADVADASQPERVWLVHRGGFTAAIRLPSSSSGRDEEHKLNLRLLHNGEQLTVDEDDVEKQNSPALDLAEDICELKYLNEASVLHCLRQRYASNLIHTKAGPTLLVVNPMAPLSLYSEKVVVTSYQLVTGPSGLFIGCCLSFVGCLHVPRLQDGGHAAPRLFTGPDRLQEPGRDAARPELDIHGPIWFWQIH